RGLDVVSAALQQRKAGREALECPHPLSRIPVEATKLPVEARLGSPVARLAEMGAHGLVVLDGLSASSERPQEVAQMLSNGELFGARAAFPKGAEGPLVVSEGVFVRIHGTCTVSRGEQETCATPTVGT